LNLLISSTIFTLDKAKRAFVLFSLNQIVSFWSVFVSFGLAILWKKRRNFADESRFIGEVRLHLSIKRALTYPFGSSS